MKTIHISYGGPDRRIRDATGKVWRFEMHHHSGPAVQDARGELADKQPVERSRSLAGLARSIARQVAGFHAGQEVSGLCGGVIRARFAGQVSGSISIGEHRAGQLVAQAEAQQRPDFVHRVLARYAPTNLGVEVLGAAL